MVLLNEVVVQDKLSQFAHQQVRKVYDVLADGVPALVGFRKSGCRDECCFRILLPVDDSLPTDVLGRFCLLRHLIKINILQFSQHLLRTLIDDTPLLPAVPVHEPLLPILREPLRVIFNENAEINCIPVNSKSILSLYFRFFHLQFLFLLFLRFFPVLFRLLMIALVAAAHVKRWIWKWVLRLLHRQRYRHLHWIVNGEWMDGFDFYHRFLPLLILLHYFLFEQSQFFWHCID